MSDYTWTQPELAKLDGAVRESMDSLIRAAAEKDLQKDIADRMEEELGIKKADYNALVRERFEDKSSKLLEKHEEIVELNEELKTVKLKNIGQVHSDEDEED